MNWTETTDRELLRGIIPKGTRSFEAVVSGQIVSYACSSDISEEQRERELKWAEKEVIKQFGNEE